MKRNKLTWIAMTLFVSACAVVGCAAPSEPAGDDLAGNDEVPASVLEAEQAPVYEVGIEFDGKMTTVQARATVALRAHLLDAGFKGIQGEEAVSAFLTEMAQRTVDGTGELPEGVLTVGNQEGDPSERAPNATCVSCYNVYSCTYYSSCGCSVCSYQYTVCGTYSC
ncbi:hypothetical protein WMF18_35145 [Sorangium sp. So ce315]|uniref:hypothetical protein n=1 Tax=Sorangium sp. So ce315 TaxID=3133299 RepID=UPI003F60A888